VKYFTEREEVYIENGEVFRDGKSLDKRECMFYSSYISDFTLIQEKEILMNPEVGVVLVIFSGENISEQVKIISTE
jgi:hypothetical protein